MEHTGAQSGCREEGGRQLRRGKCLLALLAEKETKKQETPQAEDGRLLTVLEGLQGKPEEDDGVEQAVQTMAPEDLPPRVGERGMRKLLVTKPAPRPPTPCLYPRSVLR